MNQVPLNISFRKALVGDKMTAWNKLVAKITNTQLSNGRDIFTWDLHNDGHFSVQSMYQYSMNQGSPLLISSKQNNISRLISRKSHQPNSLFWVPVEQPINVRKRFHMLSHAANFFEFLFKNRSLLLALSALFREETTPSVLLIWIVLRPSDTTVIIDPHPTSETSVSAWSLRYEYHGTVSLTHSFSSTSIVAEWMHRTLSLVCIWSHTHILVRSIS